MPYDYLTINEESLNTGLVSASYFPDNLQSLYEQRISDDRLFFGNSDDDIIEFSLYNSSQEPILFNRIVPKVTYSVVEGNYRDINNVSQQYSVKNPFTNYAFYSNELLLHTQFDLKINELSPGLYYCLYNPIRNIAGDSKNKLYIKEISPSRTEIRLAYAFDPNINESSRLASVKISSFAEKKYVFLQVIDELIDIINNNPIHQNFTIEQDNFNYYKFAQLLGFKTTAELQEYINTVYVGFDKLVNIGSNDDVKQRIKFSGIAEQLKNFIYKYNDVSFSVGEILEAFRLITAKVSQDGILQRTTLTETDLIDTTNLFLQIVYTDWISVRVNELLSQYSERYFDLYKNAINFDNGQLVKILDHTSYTNVVDNTVNIQIKLDSALPLQYSIRDTCWISNISIAPLYFKANLYSSPVSRKVFLNGVNFSVKVPTVNPTNDQFESDNNNTLFAAESRLKQKINDLLIDYDNFSNFVNYSSAELRTKIAKNKINKNYSLIQTKNSLKQKASSANNVSISSSYADEFNRITQEQIQLLDSFDEYESYLYYNTSSISNKIEDGIDYDKQNYNSLLYQLPEYVKSDENNSDYLKFTAMVGHFFDNILIFIKKFPKTYPISYDDTDAYPKNYIEELLNSFGWNATNVKFNKSSVSQLLFNNTEFVGSLSSSYFTYAKSIFNRLANNLSYVYKTKGTANSFDLIRTIFGIPAELINVTEYTSPDVLVNRNVFYDFDDTIYATKYDSNQYVNFNFTGSEYSSFITSQWTSGSTNISGANQITRSFVERFTGISTIEATFRSDQYKNYNYLDKIPLIKKIRNNKVDWQIYLHKAKQKESANLVFELTPFESGVTSSIKSKELPYLNGDFYTFMIRREPDESISIDNLSLVTQSVGVTQSIYSYLAEQYIPFIYSLQVNQYYGSQLNFTDKVNKNIVYSQNQYFSSGSYYVGNFSSSIQFIGNIDKIKVQKTAITDEDFEEHSYNLNSISIIDKEEEYNSLYFLWSFDTPVNLYGTPKVIDNQNNIFNSKFKAYNFGRSTLRRGYPYCDVISTDTFPYQFEKFNIKQSINSNRYGPNYRANANINKISQIVDSNLVPYEYSSYTNDILGGDSNLVGYFISPYSYLNNKIEDFLGKEGISDVIGDPKYLTSRSYPELKKLQSDFAKSNVKYVYPQEYYSTYKFYIDFSIFDFVKKLTPSRSTLKTGLLLEPSIFERVKFNYRDINVETFTGNTTSSLITFNFRSTFTSSLINTNDTSSNTTVDISHLNSYKTDHDTYNYSSFEIKDVVDDRDFIYFKYGKYVNVDKNGYTLRDVIIRPRKDFYQLINSDGKPSTFTGSFNVIEVIGSGSGLLSSQITGSKVLNHLYSGSHGNGYSNRHLSKFIKVGTRSQRQAVTGSYFRIKNGVKTVAPGKISYYTYTKGKNSNLTTVNRKGLPNGSSPIITIPGFLKVDMESDNFPTYGTLTGSIDSPNSIFVQLPLTCSTCTSASLNNYIMNL